MNKIVGTWIGPSDETYEFNGGLCRRIHPGFDRGAPTTAGYRINGTTLTLAVSVYSAKDEEKIHLTFSDGGNRVRFDWIDGTKRRWDDAESVWLRRGNTD